MGELTPVLEVDGRRIGSGEAGPVTRRLRELYRLETARQGTPIPF
jgi:branched-chain amino acid aminotransferase